MQLHELKPRTKNYKYPRVGRGGKRGKTAGKGTKGQKARAGRKMRPELRDIIKKFPKARGYRFASTVDKPAVINIGDLEGVFTAGTEVTPTALVQMKLVRRLSGKNPKVKILGNGELTTALTFTDILLSKSAKAAIEKAGGKVSEPRAKRANEVAQAAKTVAKEEKKVTDKKNEATKAAAKKDAAKAAKKVKAPKPEKADKAVKAEKKEDK